MNNPQLGLEQPSEASTSNLQPATPASPACEPEIINCQPATHVPAQESVNPSIQESIARLARLSRIEYDLARRAEAKRLHVRLATLDDAVDRVRIVEDDAQADAYVLPRLEPWPEPIVDAPALFGEVQDRYLLYLYLPPGAAVVLTLWPAHAAAVGAFTHTPRLNLTSSDPGCGKTTTLELMATLIPKVLRTDNLKPAVLFRVVHREQPAQPALVLDELDTYLHLYPELRGLINAGHSPGACVYRCEGGVVRSFKVFAATALAGLGHIAPTLRDRSIVIPLVKAPPGALRARFDKRRTETETILGRQIARWAQDNFAAIVACDPVMPPEAYNRLGDNWPLFAIAQIIGGDWPQRVLDAFQALNPKSHEPEIQNQNPKIEEPGSQPSTLNTPPPESSGHQPSTLDPQLLLADLRSIFTQSGADRLFSTLLVDSLRALPNRPWSGANNGDKPITQARLARELAAFSIYPALLRIGQRRAKGYKLADLADPKQGETQTR